MAQRTVKKRDGEGGWGRTPSRDADSVGQRSYGQVEDTIVTVSTFSFGALEVEVEDDEVLVELELLADADSTVPVIETLCPTWGVSLLSSPSSRYVLAALLWLDVPVVPVAELEPDAGVTLVSMNLELMSELAPAVPVVPVLVCSARWRHPVTVTLSLELVLCAVDEPAVCAARLAAAARAIAAHVPVHSFLCMVAS